MNNHTSHTPRAMLGAFLIFGLFCAIPALQATDGSGGGMFGGGGGSNNIMELALANKMIGSMNSASVERMKPDEVRKLLSEVMEQRAQLMEDYENVPDEALDTWYTNIKAIEGTDQDGALVDGADLHTASIEQLKARLRTLGKKDPRTGLTAPTGNTGETRAAWGVYERALADKKSKIKHDIDQCTKALEERREEVVVLKKKRMTLRELGAGQKKGGKIQKPSEVVKARLKELKKQEKHYEEIVAKGGGYDSTIGMAAVRGLVGRDGWFIFNDLKPQSLAEGLMAGATYRFMNVIGNKLQQTIEREGGEIWDSIIGGGAKALKNGLLNGWYWLMHGNSRPFTVTRLQRWKQEVLKVVLDGLAKAAIDSQKNMSKGRDAKMREMFDGAGDPNAAPVNNSDPTWQAIASGYSQDLERLARRIEAHKAFYGASDDADEQRIYMSERCDILALATRLQETLRLVKDHIFEPSGSLQDLAAGDQKLLLPQLYKDIEQRFDLLIKVITEYHGNNSRLPAKSATSGSSSNTSSSNGLGGGLGGGLNFGR